MADIKQTGMQNWRSLQKENASPYSTQNTSNDDLMKLALQIGRSSNKYLPAAQESVGIEAAQAGYGDSQYDDAVVSATQLENLGEVRYAKQSWYDVLGNGLGKMLGKAGTTILSSLIGMPYGIGTAIHEGRWSGLWDNSVTEGLANIDDWMEKNMTNYQSRAQQNDPNFRFGDLNWWADNFIANAGFTIGAAASMAIGGGALGMLGKAFNLVNTVGKTTKGAATLLSALFSATGEGMVEAKQGVDERNKLAFQELDDSLAPEKQALDLELASINEEFARNKGQSVIQGADGKLVDPAYITYKQRMEELQNKRDAFNTKRELGRQQIEEEGRKMGNRILAGNQVLLTLGNMIQFSKGIMKSFDNARHVAESTAKSVKPTLMGATRTAAGYEMYGKGLSKMVALTKNPITEGMEEMNQQFIQSTAAAMYDKKNANDYWQHRLSPEGLKDVAEGTYTFGEALGKGFKDSYGTAAQWEQFVIGAMMGATGVYMPTKVFNRDKTKAWYDPRRYGSWEGGIASDWNDFKEQYGKYSENIDDLNRVVQSQEFPARLQSFVAHTVLQDEKEKSADADDKKAWKDADDKQFIHDVQAFARVGKLNDLRAMYREVASNLSDDAIDKLVEDTTQEVSEEDDKQKQTAYYSNLIADTENEIKQLKAKREAMRKENSPKHMTVEQRKKYAEIVGDISSKEDQLKQYREASRNYQGKKSYLGPYVDEKGNRTKTNDQIRDELSHNSEELEKKLDSYLESINFVNERTNGVLSKDQEDNLAYLHNMGKSSIDRMQKIMKGARKDLPNKFLLKTSKSPEDLVKEYASSDLSFKESDKEGYVEVDTSRMNDAAFADFFQREILRGGNINPFIAETADERAYREEEEGKKRNRGETVKRKTKEEIEQDLKDANEQWQENWNNIVAHFQDTVKAKNPKAMAEAMSAFANLAKDIGDAAALYNQAGEFWRTLNEYMRNPGLVDRDKQKEEEKQSQNYNKNNVKSQLGGKSAKDIKQGAAAGEIDLDGFNVDDIDMDDDDPELKQAVENMKKAQQGNNKAAALKKSIQDNLGPNPSAEDAAAADIAIKMVDAANLNTENPEDLNIDTPELQVNPADIDPNLTLEEFEALQEKAKGMIAVAFNDLEEASVTLDDVPDLKTGAVDADTGEEEPETGRDPVATGPVINPTPDSPAEGTDTTPKGPITEEAVDTVINETKKVLYPNTSSVWISTTTRNPYGTAEGTYHEDVAKKTFGEDSIEYKRSKAIWEYLNGEHTFDRQDNVSADRIQEGNTVHFMVVNLADKIYGKSYSELTEQEKPFALAIVMLNDKNEVIGDLSLAQLEESYKAGTPTPAVQELLDFQNKVFEAYNKSGETSKPMIVDSGAHRAEAGNLNMTFEGTDSPLVSSVDQVMRGSIPFVKNEINTLNDIAGDGDLQIAVRGKGNKIYTKKGDKGNHSDIVIPNVGSAGQPYILLSTPSGEKIAVPFYTKPFDPTGRHKDTRLHKALANALSALISPAGSAEENRDNFKRNFEAIKSLLQVARQDGKQVVEKKAGTLTLHLQSVTDKNVKYDITVPSTGKPYDDAVAMLDQLSGIPINIGISFMNDTMTVGNRMAGTAAYSYNEIIGEVADANLPKNTTQTTNGWFTVKPVSKTKVEAEDKLKPRTTGTYIASIGGKNVRINADKLTASDPETGDTIKGDEKVNLYLAEIRANQPINRGKDRIQVSIDGKVRTYDTKKKRFITVEEKKGPKEEGTTPPAGPFTPKTEKVTPETVQDHIQITNTSNGISYIFPVEGWNKSATADVRTSVDGWGTNKGFTYYKKSISGRGGDNITIWFKEEPSEDVKRQMELFLEKGKRLDDTETLAKILNGEKVYALEKVTPENIHEHVQITSTMGGYSLELPVAKWNTKVVDLRDAKTGWGEHEGLTYYALNNSPETGRDTTIIWFKENPPKAIKEQVNILVERAEELDTFDDFKKVLAKILNGGKAFEEKSTPKESKGLSKEEVKDQEKRAEHSKLLHKEDVVNVVTTKRTFYCFIRNDRYPRKTLYLSYTYVGQKWELEVLGTDDKIKDESTIQEFVHHYIPKDLQEFLNNYKPSSSNATELRDRWGIYTWNTLSDTYNTEDSEETGTQGEQPAGEGNPPVESTTKTLEQIEEEMKAIGVISKQTADAWRVIPEALKLKIGNGGVEIKLSSGNKTISVNTEDRSEFIKALKSMSMFAKKGKLTVEETAKYRAVNSETQRRADIRKEKAWLQKNLPMFSTEERLKFIQGLIRIAGAKSWAWGRFEKGVITLSDSAARGTLYHEAFHAVTQTLLSDEELDALYEAAEKRYKEQDAALLEELLAEDFRKYVQRGETPIVGPILRFFRRIINAIRNRTGYRAPIQQLFYQINNGKFKETVPSERSGGNAFYRRYIDRINEELLDIDNDTVREVIQSFKNNRGLIGDKYSTGRKWTEFKNYWKGKGVAVKGGWRHISTGIAGYALNDVKLIVNGKEVSIGESNEQDTQDRVRRAEEHGVKQARNGRRELISWERLSPEQQMNLMDSGMSEDSYTSMSLEEQEQWLQCRS